MSRCTAPVRGHRTASGAAACPACGGGYGRYGGYGGYSPRPYYPPAYEPRSGGGGTSSRGGSSRSARPSWSSSNSTVNYTPVEVRSLTPIRRTVEERARAYPDIRDVFLCHAWDDRHGAAKEMHDLLESNDVSVWFSEKDVMLGAPLLRAIDKGLAKSRAGIVLVTPALLTRLASEGIADKELSELLAREQLIPVVHGTTYEASPGGQPLARLAKRPKHRRRLDGGHRSQDRRAGPRRRVKAEVRVRGVSHRSVGRVPTSSS
jgi:TIR domain